MQPGNDCEDSKTHSATSTWWHIIYLKGNSTLKTKWPKIKVHKLIIFSGVNKSAKRFHIKQMFMVKNEAGHLFLCKSTIVTSDGLGTTLTALFIFLSMVLFCFTSD